MGKYGQESLWRDTAAANAQQARDLAARLERRAKAEDEVAARDTYLGLLDIAAGERMLDVGCGSGAVTREIARRVGRRGLAVGLDPSPALLDVARELAQEQGQIRNAEAAARTLRLQLQPVLTVRDVRTLEASLEAAVRSGASAALRMVDFAANTLRVETARLAMKHRLPIMYAFREDVDVGGLVAYGASVPAQYQQAATFVHKILQGAKPGDLPVEQPTKFELVINLKTAKTLGLTIPPSLLLRADHVVE